MSFTWDFNPATLLALMGAGIAVIKFWIDADRKADRAIQIARDAQKDADAAQAAAKKAQEDASERIGILQAALTAYRETQAERLVSREILREVEERLASSIEKVGERLDHVVRELVKLRE